jgi:probable rRNA maturation factor
VTDLEISNHQSHVRITDARVRKIVRAVFAAERAAGASLSVAITDNAAVRAVNREFLQHDYDTDVLSFLFESLCVARDATPFSKRRRAHGRHIDGEVLVSAEMAAKMAPRFSWTPLDELTLYLVHGLLHLCGYDDQTPGERRVMREREREVLAAMRIVMPLGQRRRRAKRRLPARSGNIP